MRVCVNVIVFKDNGFIYKRSILMEKIDRFVIMVRNSVRWILLYIYIGFWGKNFE